MGIPKVKPTIYVHFTKTRYTPEPEGDNSIPETMEAYSWYLEASDGSRMTMSDRRWLSAAAVIHNAIDVLGDKFWEKEHVVIQDEWYKLITGKEREKPAVENEQDGISLVEDPKEEDGSLRNDLLVELVNSMGNDQLICQAARVSTLGADSLGTEESAGLINFLMKNRHGSPFEHGTLTFRITAPIFVWREFMRHRIGFSYNEQSGRYMELAAEAYIPAWNRPLVQVGKPGAYSFEKGTDAQFELVIEQLSKAYDAAWSAYHTMLDAGIAKEMARVCLPVATYSTAYVTCNPRSLMSFLSLRTQYPDSKFPSYPQWEIRLVADQMETIFMELFPTTWKAFNENGRVSP